MKNKPPISRDKELLYGSKRITQSNWRKPDIPRLYPKITPGFWIQNVVSPKINAKVPEEVGKLFEVARGLMAYGWFFYPLIALGFEQQYWVMEMAATKRCEQLRIHTTIRDEYKLYRSRFLSEMLKDLVLAKQILGADEEPWKAYGGMRNSYLHQKGTVCIDPEQACISLHSACDLINRLFETKSLR